MKQGNKNVILGCIKRMNKRTCVPHRDHHHGRDDDVDGEGCDHLLACAPESDLVLPDIEEVSLVPVGERGGIVDIFQNVKEFFSNLTSAFESRRC